MLVLARGGYVDEPGHSRVDQECHTPVVQSHRVAETVNVFPSQEAFRGGEKSACDNYAKNP